MKILLILALLGSNLFVGPISCTPANNKEIAHLPRQDEITISGWNVYWDNEDIEEEIKVLQGDIHGICYFAAYFDREDNLFIPEEVTNAFNRVKKEFKDIKYTHYLSIVNDKLNQDGTSSLKDTELLYRLFYDENKLQSHMDHIINLALENGYDGIEIDYEGMKKDEQLWRLFADYCKKLYGELEKNNLKMRIVLEPSLPTYNLNNTEEVPNDLNFVEGPDYIMMCYNLYGLGTEPGPKADKSFILDLVAKMEPLPGKKYFAFATGGFDWGENEKVTSVTEQEANRLMASYQVKTSRDESSQCLNYKYVDENGVNHEVWFADGTTLAFWIETVKNTGNYNFSIWRLGGNDKDSLKELILTTNKYNRGS